MQITIKLDQVQIDGSFFKMPVEIAVFYPGKILPQIQTVQADAKSNVFSINVSVEPEKVVLDPNMWILMDADFQKPAKRARYGRKCNDCIPRFSEPSEQRKTANGWGDE